MVLLCQTFIFYVISCGNCFSACCDILFFTFGQSDLSMTEKIITNDFHNITSEPEISCLCHRLQVHVICNVRQFQNSVLTCEIQSFEIYCLTC